MVISAQAQAYNLMQKIEYSSFTIELSLNILPTTCVSRGLIYYKTAVTAGCTRVLNFGFQIPKVHNEVNSW